MYIFQQGTAHKGQSYSRRLGYRYFSRQVIAWPTNIELHTSRVMAALELPEAEPLQGALADMFYGCWFDVPFFGERILSQVKDQLHPNVLQGFQDCVDKNTYMQTASPLATRWSVLVTPSMTVYPHQMRISPDDSKALANNVINVLLDYLEDDEAPYNHPEVIQTEDDFFAHCLACEDILAFSLAWWGLAKNGWELDSRWVQVQEQLPAFQR